jgi:hypothetical protein
MGRFVRYHPVTVTSLPQQHLQFDSISTAWTYLSGLESWKFSCGIRCADHMSTQYRLVQSVKTASGGCSAGQGSSEPVAPRIFFEPIYSHGTCHVSILRMWRILSY